MVEFLKLVFNTFWNNQNKYLKWFNRIFSVALIIIIGVSTFIVPKQKMDKTLQYQSNFAFNDYRQQIYNKHFNKAKKSADEYENMNQKEKDSAKGMIKYNYAQKVNMGANPDMTYEMPPLDSMNYIDTLKHHVTKDEKENWQKFVILTSGQTEYVYQKLLMKSFGLSNIKVGFAPFTGDLYINPEINNYSPEKIKQVKERANYIWNSSELSTRVKKLTIHIN